MFQILKNSNRFILQDSFERNIVQGEIEGDNQISVDQIIDILHNPYLEPRFRISILNPDESVSWVIPNQDIVEGSISYSQDYQQGQRRNVSFTLINFEGKYKPMVNRGRKRIWINEDIKKNDNPGQMEVGNESQILIWKSTMFKFDEGIKINNNIVWFDKGIFCLGSIDSENQDSDKKITIQLKDKFSKFEDSTGKLLDAYEIKEGSLARQVIKDLLNTDFGNGYPFDPKEFFIDTNLYDFRIQADIKKEAGDTLGAIFLDIATQMSAECYYNEQGNLVFYSLNETLNDQGKLTCWEYTKKYKEIISLNIKHEFENVVNMIKVIGDNIDHGIHSALVVNNDPRSPICIQNIGKCPDDIITDASIWSKTNALDLGRYNLRKKSLLPLSISAEVKWNPLLTVDFLCEIDDDFYGFKREKCVINSLSYSDNQGVMSLNLTNIQDLQFINAGDGGYDG